jgi:hypothetical protein
MPPLFQAFAEAFKFVGQRFRGVGTVLYQALEPLVEVLIYLLNPVMGRVLTDARKRKKRSDSLLEDRLAELADAMRKSSELVTEVEAALQAREAAVERLRAEAETAQQIKDMTEEQQQAVANVLRAEVVRGGRKALWQGAGVNAFFFLAGVVVTLWVGK